MIKQISDPLYIFLDIDGVLNAKPDWTIKFSIRESCLMALKECVKQLRKIYPEIRVVICSTWRAGKSVNGDSDAKQYLVLRNKLQDIGIDIYGETPISNKGRQAEVEYYIRRNAINYSLIIDDDPSLYDDISRLNFYKPDYRTGLKKEDVKRIVKQLN